jgi:DNA-binding NarL/FixJ family response regulator
MSNLRDYVLIVDDEFIITQLLTIYVEDIGRVVCGTAATADAAIALAQKHRPAIVLMDMRLKGVKDGVDAAIAIHDTVGSKVIFITGSSEASTMERISLDHASSVLIKPVTESQLREAIQKAARGLEGNEDPAVETRS